MSFSKSVATVGPDVEFYTLTTKSNILTEGADSNATTKALFAKVMKLVSLRAQPVIVGKPVKVGTGVDATYVARFVLPAVGTWRGVSTTLPATLIAAGLDAATTVDISASL